MRTGSFAVLTVENHGQPFATWSSDAAPLLPAVENNDEILLARVEKSQLLSRSAYEFFNVKIGTLLGLERPAVDLSRQSIAVAQGIELDGTTSWTTDSTIARSVWEFPLMTSVQQANYHPGLKRCECRKRACVCVQMLCR